MKPLVITQIVDKGDSNLGFFHRWIEEFARHTESVEVICLKKGDYALPKNVRIHSLGKPHFAKASRGAGRLWQKFLYIVRFYKYIYRLRGEYDAVFVHMNPEYILLAGWLWKRWKKKTSLWYAHRSNNAKLRRAVRLVNYVFTVSPDSFSVPTPKLKVMGHGIDTESFKPGIKEESTHLRITTIGRIAPSKHLLEMLGLLVELEARKESFVFSIVGEPTTEAEAAYARKLAQKIKEQGLSEHVRMLGPISHQDLPQFLLTQDVALNFSTTGNMDKAGLEALVSGVVLLASNPQFEPMLKPYGLYAPSMHPTEAADKLLAFFNRPDQPAVLATLRNKVIAEHSLSSLIPRILRQLSI
jgi:glycosyltransferase involved in cell wall biosynthesis